MLHEQYNILLIVFILALAYFIYTCDTKQDDFSADSVGEISKLDSGDVEKSGFGRGVAEEKMKKRVEDVANNLSGYEDYNSVTKYMAIEPEVFDDQREYTENLRLTRGASTLATRSDPNDVVPFVGLRRPDYHSVYAAEDARVVHSEYPDQQYEYRPSCLF